jgi:hypothetical protein
LTRLKGENVRFVNWPYLIEKVRKVDFGRRISICLSILESYLISSDCVHRNCGIFENNARIERMLNAFQNIIVKTFGRVALNSQDDSRVCDDFIRHYSTDHSHFPKENAPCPIFYSRFIILWRLFTPKGRKFPNRMHHFVLSLSFAFLSDDYFVREWFLR